MHIVPASFITLSFAQGFTVNQLTKYVANADRSSISKAREYVQYVLYLRTFENKNLGGHTHEN